MSESVISVDSLDWPDNLGTDNALLESANQFFRDRALDHIETKRIYRLKHSGILSPLDSSEAKQIADLHKAMMYKVFDARMVLTVDYQEDLNAWQSSTGKVKEAYKVVLADKLASNLQFKNTYFSQESDFYSDCYSVVQWLDGWLQSETL